MIIGIVMKDKLACKMFVDFYRHIYLNRGKPLTIAPSLYNSADVIEGQIAKAKEAVKGGPLFIIMEVPPQRPFSNPPEALMLHCDMVVGLDRGMVPDPIKVTSEGHLAILQRFEANIQKFAG